MRSFFERCARLGGPASGALAVGAAGAIWAVLCLFLAAGGHEPSFTLVPIARERYYLAQAAFVVPVVLLLWLVCTAVASRVARALGGVGSFRRAATPIGCSLALPLVALFLVPDFVAYFVAGFDALGVLVRFTAPLSFVATVALVALAIRASHGLAPVRALVAASSGVIAQALISGVLLR